MAGKELDPTLFIPAASNRETERRRVSQIRQLVRAFLPCKVAEIGAGSGYIGVLLTRDGASVTSVDITDHRVLEEARPNWITMDAVAFSLDCFDIVVCAGLLYHLNIEQQKTLAARFIGKTVILDTHFSRTEDSQCGRFTGQFRLPTASSKVEHPFVHNVPSLRRLFEQHFLIETFERLTFDRQVMLLIPK